MVEFINKKYEVLDGDKTLTLKKGQRLLNPFTLKESNVFFVGLRGSGKSTLAKAVARDLGAVFVDTDFKVEEQAGQTIAHLVSEQGWEGFRNLEHQVLEEVCKGKNQVVATGGGIVLRKDNCELLKKHGLVFYLMADVPLLISRLSCDPKTEQRPALSELPVAEELQSCLNRREPLYFAVLDHILPAALPIEELVSRVRQELELRL